MDKLLNCPFCGNEMDINDPDVLYPTGDVLVKRPFMGRLKLTWAKLQDFPVGALPPKDQWMYGVHCSEHNGGCGVSMEGGNAEKVIKKWNTRTI